MPLPEDVLSKSEEEELMALGTDLHTVWNHPQSDIQLKKRILRTAVKEIVISISNGIVKAVIHWEGDDHSEVQFPKSRTGCHRFRTDIETERLIRELARIAPDLSIASLLNHLGKKTARGNSWTQTRIASFRNDHNIAVYQDGEVEKRGELFLDQAAENLGVHKARIYTLIRKGLLPAKQVCMGAPWIIRKEKLTKCEYLLFGTKSEANSIPLTAGQENLFHDGTTT